MFLLFSVATRPSATCMRVRLHNWFCRRGQNLRLLSELLRSCFCSRHEVAGLVFCFFRHCARLPRPRPRWGGVGSPLTQPGVLCCWPRRIICVSNCLNVGPLVVCFHARNSIFERAAKIGKNNRMQLFWILGRSCCWIIGARNCSYLGWIVEIGRLSIYLSLHPTSIIVV